MAKERPMIRTSKISVGYGTSRSGNKMISLSDMLATNGLGDFASAFAKQDIVDVETAISLSLEEVRMVLSSNSTAPTIGAVRNCHRVLADVASSLRARGCESQHQPRAAAPTPQSVLSRSLLSLSPEDLHGALNARVNAETVFSSLMLTVAAAALIEIPDAEACDVEFGITSCDRLRSTYLIAWGIASAGFSMACLVSLGSMQLFFGHASAYDVHHRFIGGEIYLNLSHNFICVGLMIGLLPGLCLNLFLRFPQFHWSCAIVSSFLWMLFILQLVRGFQSVKNTYADFPGFSSIWEFLQGYLFSGKTIMLIPCLEPQLQLSVKSLDCKRHNSPTEFHKMQDSPTDIVMAL